VHKGKVRMSDLQQLSLLDVLIDGQHERCQNPRCRKPFPFKEGVLIRVRGMDNKYYCNVPCASAQYLAQRPMTPVRNFSGS
jgi:hypothetical protein